MISGTDQYSDTDLFASKSEEMVFSESKSFIKNKTKMLVIDKSVYWIYVPFESMFIILIYSIFCCCLDLAQQKWLISSKSNINSYLQVKDGAVGIETNTIPLNYEDNRVATFEAKEPAEHEKITEEQKGLSSEERTPLNEPFMITLSNMKICRQGNYQVVIPCDGFKRDKNVWRVKETLKGYQLINEDMCLTIRELSVSSFANKIGVGLEICGDKPEFFWKLEVMPRNITLPEDMDEKYKINNEDGLNNNGNKPATHNIFHYGNQKSDEK